MRSLSVTFVLLLVVASAYSATLNVPTDYPTIQDGIDAAVNGDIVLVADGVYTGEGNRDIEIRGKYISVVSMAGPERTTIDCDTLGRAFLIIGCEESRNVIEGFTIRNGKSTAGGAIRIERASAKISTCVFYNNVAPHGGAIYINSPSSRPIFVNCQFLNNRAVGDTKSPMAGRGGAVYAQNEGYLARFTDCLFANNTAYRGGGLCCNLGFGYVLQGCTMVANIATSEGAALYHGQGHATEMDRCLVAFNAGGAAVSCYEPIYNIANTDIYGNEGGNWISYLAALADVNNNCSQEPDFCGMVVGDYHISALSPCSPRNNSSGQLIGALGVVCNEVPCGDTNRDGVVDILDVVYLQELHFGQTPPGYFAPVIGDMDCDIAITLADLAVLAGYLHGYGPGVCCDPSAQLPGKVAAMGSAGVGNAVE